MNRTSDALPMPGEHVDAWLDRYRTGELSETQRRAVAGHVAACARCAAELEELRAFSDRMARGFRAAAGTARSEAAWAAQRRAILARTAAPPPRHRGLPRFAPQAALVAVALIAVAVVWRAGAWKDAGGVQRLPIPERTAVAPRAGAPGSDRRAKSAAPQNAAEVEELKEEDRREQMARRGRGAGADAAAGAADELRDGAALRDEMPAPEDQVRAVPPEFATPPEVAPKPPAAADAAEGEDVSVHPEREEDLDRELPSAAAPPPADEAAAKARQAPTNARAEDAVAREDARLEAQVETIGTVSADSVFARYRAAARDALAKRDTALAASTGALWRDTLGEGSGMDPASRAEGQALADSLTEMIAR